MREEKRDDSYIEGLFSFIDKSPTCFHAVENVGRQLEEAGYHALTEKICGISKQERNIM